MEKRKSLLAALSERNVSNFPSAANRIFPLSPLITGDGRPTSKLGLSKQRSYRHISLPPGNAPLALSRGLLFGNGTRDGPESEPRLRGSEGNSWWDGGRDNLRYGWSSSRVTCACYGGSGLAGSVGRVERVGEGRTHDKLFGSNRCSNDSFASLPADLRRMLQIKYLPSFVLPFPLLGKIINIRCLFWICTRDQPKSRMQTLAEIRLFL